MALAWFISKLSEYHMVFLQDLVARIWLRFTILLFRSVFSTVFMPALRYWPHFPREVSSGLLITSKITIYLNVCNTNIPPPPPPPPRDTEYSVCRPAQSITWCSCKIWLPEFCSGSQFCCSEVYSPLSSCPP